MKIFYFLNFLSCSSWYCKRKINNFICFSLNCDHALCILVYWWTIYFSLLILFSYFSYIQCLLLFIFLFRTHHLIQYCCLKYLFDAMQFLSVSDWNSSSCIVQFRSDEVYFYSLKESTFLASYFVIVCFYCWNLFSSLHFFSERLGFPLI